VPGSRTHPSSSSTPVAEVDELAVKQLVSLDAHELFTQLCAQSSLVRMGPHGLLTSSVTIEEGVVRIWREWLARMVGTPNTTAAADNKGKAQVVEQQVCEDERVLWVDNAKNVGLRLKVKERKWRRDNPILVSSEEEVAVSYSIEFEGKLVLCIRGTC